MENYTLTFNTMKAKVEVKPKDLVSYVLFVMFAIFVFYVATNPH
jgi:hypothetical protein